jgi:hypothetical protein
MLKVWVGLLSLLCHASVLAHAMPQSLVVLNFESDLVQVQARVPVDRLQMAHALPAGLAVNKVLPTHKAALMAYALEHVRPRSFDGSLWQVDVTDITLVSDPLQPDLLFSLRMKPQQGHSVRQLQFVDDMVMHEVVSHKILVAVGHDWGTGQLSDVPQLMGEIHFGRPYVEVSRAEARDSAGWWAAVKLGAEHIAGGFDHLLFLVVLMVPAPLRAIDGRWAARASFGRAMKTLALTVSCFTLGHSLSLIVGGLTEFRVPNQPVEALIAGSILVSCLHAWRPLLAGREYWVAAGFGVIHGMAFASTLNDLGLHGGPKVLALLGFNVGIELMQLVVVAAVLPMLFAMARWRHGRTARHVLIGSSSALALLWLGQRL